MSDLSRRLNGLERIWPPTPAGGLSADAWRQLRAAMECRAVEWGLPVEEALIELERDIQRMVVVGGTTLPKMADFIAADEGKTR